MSNYLFNPDFHPVTVQNILVNLRQIRAWLPFLVQLTPEQRKSIQNVSDGREPFVRKALKYANDFPDVFPAYIGLNNTKNHFAIFEALQDILKILGPLTEGCSDTLMVAGAQSYKATKTFYHQAKLSSANGKPGIDAVIEDLSKLFPGGGGVPNGEDEEEMEVDPELRPIEPTTPLDQDQNPEGPDPTN